MWQCVLVLLCAVATLAQNDEDWRIVNIAQGPVRGRMDPEGGVYVFYNIPYATAPTGRDRFKPPLAPPVWLSTFDAVDRDIVCPQRVTAMNVQEDCLVANVFVPDTDETNLPVLVHVHDGAYQFRFGLSNQHKDLVRTNKLIVVSFNYRLGVHGFLCLGTEGAPGNAGIKDQVAFLRWLKSNIASFGGNPEDVTLSACSAGSGSIDVLILSSITSGLFNRAIMESGVSTGSAGVQIDPIQNAKNYARILNFTDVDNLDSLEEFYKTASFELLISRVDVINPTQNISVLFGPCVERDIGQERVIADAPMNVIRDGNYTKIPLLYGFTNMEGTMRLSHFDTWINEMNERFSDFLPAELYFESEAEKEEVANRVKQFYFGNEPITENSIVEYVQYFTDVLFGGPMLRSLTARLESLGDIIYLFEYSFVDDDTASIGNTDVRGAGHCHQLMAVIDQNTTSRTEEYRQMKNIMRDYWLNFILTDSPLSSNLTLPLWLPATAERSPYMSLGPVIELKDEGILENRTVFWDSIYEQYYRGPVLPSTEDAAASVVISNVMVVAAVLTSLYLAV